MNTRKRNVETKMTIYLFASFKTFPSLSLLLLFNLATCSIWKEQCKPLTKFFPFYNRFFGGHERSRSILLIVTDFRLSVSRIIHHTHYNHAHSSIITTNYFDKNKPSAYTTFLHLLLSLWPGGFLIFLLLSSGRKRPAFLFNVCALANIKSNGRFAGLLILENIGIN